MALSSLGRTGLLVSEAIEPADGTTTEFHEWYRSEYIKQIAKLPGWRRTSRFELVFKKENKDDPNRHLNFTPKWLALHEFDEGSLPADGVTTLLGDATATDKITKSARKIDVAAFSILRGFGEKEACWVDAKASVLNSS